MKLGITLQDETGLASQVSSHFGQCQYFLLADIVDKRAVNVKVVPNSVPHGGGGCVAVDEILKYKITHVIAGGMGMGAQQKFAKAGVKVFGFAGTAKDAIDHFLKNGLGGLEPCHEHQECH
jgi:predicted Fe-Mo cluster-binding NifX family protein